MNLVWETPLSSEGLGGIAATDRLVIVGGRDPLDQLDVFDCIDARTGELIWQYRYPAPFGRMDYGTTPRATPLIVGNRVVLLGALGHLSCVDLTDGTEIWQRNLPLEFGAEMPTWGFCGSPLAIDDDAVVVQVGAEETSLAAFQLADGAIRWSSPGRESGYSSFVTGKFGGVTQLIGYDQISLGGWDAKTGKRLWELKPLVEGDFNVPTPIGHDGHLFVTTENNGSRLYSFADGGQIITEPVSRKRDLAPDTHTPVRIGRFLVGVSDGLYVLTLPELKTVWHSDDDAFYSYCSAISNGRDRVLVTSSIGEFILVGLEGSTVRIINRLRLSDHDTEITSHPAVAGSRLYFRNGRRLACLELGNPVATVEGQSSGANEWLPELDRFLGNIEKRFDTIPDSRRELLDQMAKSVRHQLAEHDEANLTFICTHNSRRSQFAQVWSQLAAAYYDMGAIHTWSGGMEVTACNERTVAAFEHAGFDAEKMGDGDNPVFELIWARNRRPIRCYSKAYSDSPNPAGSFLAVICCGDADEKCPMVKGAEARFSLHYSDPKVSDGTPDEVATYDERCLQIATEMFYLMSQVRGAGK